MCSNKIEEPAEKQTKQKWSLLKYLLHAFFNEKMQQEYLWFDLLNILTYKYFASK